MSEPNYLINVVWNWITRRPVVLAVAFVVLMVTLLGGIDSCRSRRYDKARQEYEAKENAWRTERATLLANAEAKEKRIAELEPKAIAFDALAEQNKRIDAGLAQQIDQISEDAAVEEAAAGEPVDCRIRWQRVCRAFNDRGIKLDCSIDRCR